MGVKIFLDDRRNPPSSDYIIVRNYEACTALLGEIKEIETISLDYDLNELKTGLDVVLWMKKNKKTPKNINIHSTHYHGANRMAEYIRSGFPDSVLTRNQV